jgi:hypothetical protein
MSPTHSRCQESAARLPAASQNRSTVSRFPAMGAICENFRKRVLSQSRRPVQGTGPPALTSHSGSPERPHQHFGTSETICVVWQIPKRLKVGVRRGDGFGIGRLRHRNPRIRSARSPAAAYRRTACGIRAEDSPDANGPSDGGMDGDHPPSTATGDDRPTGLTTVSSWRIREMPLAHANGAGRFPSLSLGFPDHGSWVVDPGSGFGVRASVQVGGARLRFRLRVPRTRLLFFC